jgi:hypothetical protein
MSDAEDDLEIVIAERDAVLKRAERAEIERDNANKAGAIVTQAYLSVSADRDAATARLQRIDPDNVTAIIGTETHGCGGSGEACYVPGCDECGTTIKKLIDAALNAEMQRDAAIARADRFSDILMAVCEALEIPRCEDGPCDDAAAYRREIDALINDQRTISAIARAEKGGVE